jgi:aspartokinase-like uncharacterized kinase
MSRVVVKVGGSLYDHPHLGPGLRAWLARLESPLVVPGGGPSADVVRGFDATHALGPDAAHWLAIRSLAVPTGLLRHLLPGVKILDVDQFCQSHDDLPHTWAVTTDSIAAHAARVHGGRLVLLKSVDIPPGTAWEKAAADGGVDAHFPTAARGLTVEAMNFRRWLDDFANTGNPVS